MTDGHLFIIRDDLLNLACSAWLLPTDAAGYVTEAWHKDPGVAGYLDGARLRYVPPEWSRDRVTAHPLRSGQTPMAFALPIAPVEGSTTLERLRECVTAFLDAAEREFRDRPAAARCCHLVALPPIGVGLGGAHQWRGQAIKVVVEELLHRPRSKLDVALVVNDGRKFAAAQAVRRSAEKVLEVDPWAALPKDLRDTADRLGQEGGAGRLVVFFGAGVGAGAGLPMWGELLEQVAREADLDGTKRTHLKDLDLRDQARVLEVALGGPRRLREAVEKRLERGHEHHSLGHALLANLPAEEFVTTNYDRLFESASGSAGRRLRVLPYDVGKKKGGRAWVLKLHGSLHQNDLVLTRRDYLEQVRNRTALNGIVQALLMTRHMLFVGYSLRDEDFHQVIEEVLAATGHRAPNVGTALMIRASELEISLWESVVAVVPAIRSEDSRHGAAKEDLPGAQEAEGGRLVEILLDRLTARATEGRLPYFLDQTYRGVLTDQEQEVADRLRRLVPDLRRSGKLRAAAEAFLEAIPR